jgi:hypothetical protein
MPQVAKARLEKLLGLATSRQMRKLLEYDHQVKYVIDGAARLITPVIPALGLYNVKSVKEGATKSYHVCVAFGTCSCKWVNSVQVCKHLEAVSLVHLSLVTALGVLQLPLPHVSACEAWPDLVTFGASHARATTFAHASLQALLSQV